MQVVPDEGVLVTRGVVVPDVKSSCVGRVVVVGSGNITLG
jgi:hypothetical protein